MKPDNQSPFVFPEWVDRIRPVVALVFLAFLPAYAILFVSFAFSPETTDVGYAPVQPVPYSHALHAGEMGIDCRYCHNTVEIAAHAAVPPTATCMNCHAAVRAKSEKLLEVRKSHASGDPIRWVRVHDLPGYAYFDHSAHVRRGVGCVECHGRVDKMDVVRQVAPLSMGWCLDCHRGPEPRLRPAGLATRMDWKPVEERAALGARLRESLGLHPSTDCSTCHR